MEGEAPAAGEQGEESAGLHVEEEQSEWPESDMVMEAEASGEGVPGAELCLIMPGLFPEAPDCAAASCCISAVAFLLLSFLKSDVLRDLSPWWWLRRWPPLPPPPDLFPPAPLLLAILIAWGSLLRPPVLMEVVSRAVALRVTASPPDMSSWRTWVCISPCTGSPLMWVTRSPGRSPASKAGEPLSTW